MKNVYSENAERFFAQYQQLNFDEVHGDWLHHLPERAGLALDMGAGSGRDAAALAQRGWEVLAVEPAAGLRTLGEESTAGLSVQWLDDALPGLNQVRTLGYRFELILVSAVWMHLPVGEQQRAFRVLTDLLAPSGVLVITLRHGPSPDARVFHDVDRQHIESWARDRALMPVYVGESNDQQQRTGVRWETMVFRLPDDGTGALPVLRHIIVNDNKSATYKLGLLRSVARIAETVPGIVLNRSDHWVDIPLGAVGLYWIKLYQPLILRYGLRQAPGARGYGFAGKAFHALADVSGLDIAIGQPIASDLMTIVVQAIRDVVNNIVKMPVRFTTWPGSQQPVFEAQVRRANFASLPLQLDKESLSAFGALRVPASLWDCFSRFNCWLEPAIVNEWVRLMRSYGGNDDIGRMYQALYWQEGKRDTSRIRTLVARTIQEQRSVRCVWTDADLSRNQYDIDHCLPWVRWSNNDLWNLMPASRKANAAKSERLPGIELMTRACPRILTWWSHAFMDGPLEHQFFTEAQASLPTVNANSNLEDVFEGLMLQRLRLRANQQLPEWHGLKG
ncbi:HNH endonuclease domain-containing protein [Kushneria sp. EE4]